MESSVNIYFLRKLLKAYFLSKYKKQPKMAEAPQTKAEKDFADLLSKMMDCVENYQEGEAGEGNYLVAMNCLRDLHKFKTQLKTNVVYHHYEAVARAPPARPAARRKKLTDEAKREAGYKTCLTCGCLFADNSKLKRHQETTEKCRHIRIEKEVALTTKRIFRDKVYRPMDGAYTPVGRTMDAPCDHTITKDHPYYPIFITQFLLCFAHREQYIAENEASANDFPMTKNLGEGLGVVEDETWCPSASFTRRENAAILAKPVLCDPTIHYNTSLDNTNHSIKYTCLQYSRTTKHKEIVFEKEYQMPLDKWDKVKEYDMRRKCGVKVAPGVGAEEFLAEIHPFIWSEIPVIYDPRFDAFS